MRQRERPRRWWLPAIMVLLAASASIEAVEAHPRATSLSSWELPPAFPGEAVVQVRVPWSELQRALPPIGGVVPSVLAVRPELQQRVDDYLVAHHRLFAAGEACWLDGSPDPVASSDPTHHARRWTLVCDASGPAAIAVDVFQASSSSHLHIARARQGEGPWRDRVFVSGSSAWRLDAPASGPSDASFLDYLELGVEHIATGYDHIVFVLALLLAGTSIWRLASVVTGFTVAHSVTLALGVLGLVEPRATAIEALIGLSIVVVAVENFAETSDVGTRRGVSLALVATVLASLGASLLGWFGLPALALLGVAIFCACYLALLPRVVQPERLRWFVALVFGLIHGFGFAGILAETGLPRERVVPALLGFNLGVELGQLVIVAVGYALLVAIVRGDDPRRRRVVQLASAPILAVGLYWFLSRGLG